MRRLSVFLAVCLWHAAAQTGPTLVSASYGAIPSVNLAPGQIVTFWVAGMSPLAQSPVQAGGFPLPGTLGGISASITQIENPKGLPLGTYPVPLISVAQSNVCTGSATTAASCLLTGIIAQVPFEMQANPFTEPPYTSLTISQNGVASQVFNVTTANDSVHVLTTCGAFGNAVCVTHPDGTLVTASAPAAPGETVTIYAVGLGLTTPPVASGQATPSPAPVVLGVNLYFDFRTGAAPQRPANLVPAAQLVSPEFAGLTPGEVGLYQVNVQIPASYATGAGCPNLTIDIGTVYFSYDGAPICVTVQ